MTNTGYETDRSGFVKRLKLETLNALIAEKNNAEVKVEDMTNQLQDLLGLKRNADTQIEELGNQVTTLTGQLKDAQRENRDIKEQVVELNSDNSELNRRLQERHSLQDGSGTADSAVIETLRTQHAAVLKTKNDRIKELENDNSKLADALAEATKALKDGGKFSKIEQKDDIKKQIAKWIKEVGFRTTKFAKDGELDKFTDKVYDKINEDLGLNSDDDFSKEEFRRIYKSEVQNQLGTRRQYVQTQGLGSFKSKSILGIAASKIRVSYP